jgi:hypothetical protein
MRPISSDRNVHPHLQSMLCHTKNTILIACRFSDRCIFNLVIVKTFLSSQLLQIPLKSAQRHGNL